MRKLLVSAAFLSSLALGVVAGSVHDAAAAPDGNANCVGQDASEVARVSARFLGTVLISEAAKAGGLGQLIGRAASSNCEF